MASNPSNDQNQEAQNSPSSSSEAGEIIATSQDLTSQILLRLPATLITHKKLVSKQWLSTISDPNFILTHNLHHPPIPSGLFLNYLTRPKSGHKYVPIDQSQDNQPLPFVSAQNSQNLTILQSCNGLLLCSSSNITEYYICNPMTLQKKQLPLPKAAYPGSDFALNLAFDPKTSVHYKVICIRRLLGQQSKYQVEAYSSETGLWRALGEPFVDRKVIDFKRGVFCKGSIHWLTTTSSCVYFDLKEETMKSTPEPPPGKHYPFTSHEYFGQFNGDLYFVVKRPLPNFTLLQMKDDYSGWFTKYVIDLDSLVPKHPSMARNLHDTPRFYPHYECNVLSMVRGGDRGSQEITEEIVLSMPGEIVRFDPSTNESKKIADLAPREHDHGSVWYKDFVVHEYIQTLAPV